MSDTSPNSSADSDGTPLLQIIRTREAAFSRAERQVAQFILAHPARSTELSISEVAVASGVSEPTVIRFCRRLGFGGFRDFLRQLIIAITQPDERYIHRDVRPDDVPGTAAGKVLDSAVSALIGVRDRCADMPFAEAAQVIATSRQVIFAGIGASGHVANDAVHKFFRLGLSCAAATDLPTIQQHGAIASHDTTIVAISNRGDWPDFNQALAIAAANQANIVALTNPQSDLAHQSHLMFDCNAALDTSAYTPMNSRLMMLAVLDALQVSVVLTIGNGAEEKLKASKQAIINHTAAEKTESS